MSWAYRLPATFILIFAANDGVLKNDFTAIQSRSNYVCSETPLIYFYFGVINDQGIDGVNDNALDNDMIP